jgi:uncharacterized surface protein with fasciclin (FAS1) repeats
MLKITEVVSAELYMTTLHKGILASGLGDFLNNGGPYTLFAPSDMAFEKMQSGVVEELMMPENKVRLTQLLRNHIVEGRISFRGLKHGDKLKTLEGTELLVTENWGKTSINQATIQNRDVETETGTIHSLDKVLLD